MTGICIPSGKWYRGLYLCGTCIGYILRCRLLRYLHDRGPQARGSCKINNKATYTEVCNLLVPWQQEMQLSQELQNCTCILQATCQKYIETCRFDMLSNRSICYQIRSDMGFINLLLNNLIGQILQP